MKNLLSQMKKFGFKEIRKKKINLGKGTIISNGKPIITLKPNSKPKEEIYPISKFGVIKDSGKDLAIVDCLTQASLLKEIETSHKAIKCIICDGKIFVKKKK